MPITRRRRKRSVSGRTRRSRGRTALWVVVIAFTVVVVVGSLAEINAQSAGYRASINTGYSALASRVVIESNQTGRQLATLVNEAPNLANIPLPNAVGQTARSEIQQGLDRAVTDFEAARQKRFLRGSGLPIQIATVELIEIGAGGGSIARRSTLCTLHVGPESAGAQPGPACYGRGGTQPTVTDADLALGYLNAEFFLGGTMCIDAKAATTALGRVSDELGLDEMRGAFGVHDVVNENMAGAVRIVTVEQGVDPRDYALIAMGGAGPTHAALEVSRGHRPRRRWPARNRVPCTSFLVHRPVMSDPGPILAPWRSNPRAP